MKGRKPLPKKSSVKSLLLIFCFTAASIFVATNIEKQSSFLFFSGAKTTPDLTTIPTGTAVLQITDTPTGETTITPSATSVTPTSTPTATATVTTRPTSTPKPTAKPTSKPTSTPTPTVTHTATPTPSPTIDYSKPWTVAPNCPQTTQNCVPCTTTNNPYGDCRFEPGKTHGFRGWACQNNNPGNIRDSSYRQTLIVNNGGAAPCGVRQDSRGGSYFVFRTYTEGYGALQAYIRAINAGQHSAYHGENPHWECGDCTITQFFSKYAGSDGTYDDAVAAEIGEPVTQKLNYIVTYKLTAFTNAIKHHEGFITQ